ncbi:HLA class II histocompatibility antigen, DQ alpha 2 chain-like [Hypanus sabinus]|uniref:HLA class II histocompatibility antigen, DQ alpha 2 chain-like n=1 Tax=Hypanus sabinus TaxID=79690 RepID=UPI0028C4540B|nr:HLA class II histocompatibility antigen, DQ alpha 2 chain-like [Hypanus sabinus]
MLAASPPAAAALFAFGTVSAMGRYPAAWALLLLLVPCSGSAYSVAETDTLAVNLFSTDEPSQPVVRAEVKTQDRSIGYYDTTLSGVQSQLAGIKQFSIIIDKQLAKIKNDVITGAKKIMDKVKVLIIDSVSPNEIGELFLYSEKPAVIGEVNTLTCFVSGFFPPAVIVTLQKNEQPVSGEVNSSHLSFGKDWRFQVLHYTYIQPADGDIYSCRVLHTISKEERVIYWEPEEQSSAEEMDTSQLAVLICGLIIGILGTAVGLSLCFWFRLSGCNTWIVRIGPSSR